MSVVVQLPPELGVESPRRFALGGMGELFTAEKIFPQGGRTRLVVKHMLPQYTHTEELVSRFRDEARLGLVLRHSNIVRVLEYWEIEGHHYMVMEEVDGFDLAEVIVACRRAGQDLPQGVAAFFMQGIASALAYMADATSPDGRNLELVHRDISPSNILVSRDGVIKLIDFGVAKAAEREARTRTGYFVGKYSYMSPEQIRGEEVDIRSDLFALGVVGYQMLTGRSPFQGGSDFETMNLVLTKDPDPLDRVRRDVHPILANVVHRCIAKELDDRYDHPLKLVEDLHRYFYVAQDRPPPLRAREFLAELGLITQTERGEEDGLDPNATVPLGRQPSSMVQLKVPSDPSQPTLERERLTATMPTPDSETEPGAPSIPPTPTPAPGPAPPAAPEVPDDDAAEGAPDPAAVPPSVPRPPVRRSADDEDRESVDEEYMEEKRREQRRLMVIIPAAVMAVVAAFLLTALALGVLPGPGRGARDGGGGAEPETGADAGTEGGDGDHATTAVEATPPPETPTPREPATDTSTDTGGGPSDDHRATAQPETEYGTLQVRCIPWANVRVDGRDLGRTPITKRLPAGRHKLEATNPDMNWSHTQWVTVEADGTTPINLKSERSALPPSE